MATSTNTSRFAWDEPILADKVKVRSNHITELREAADDLDYRCDEHIGHGGLDKHPAATESSGGFVTPEEKKLLNEMRSGEDTEHTFKAGMVMEWLGDINDPPPGWAVLDGKEGRPDASGRFTLGAGGLLTPGSTGGQLDVPVPVPRHNHSSSGGGLYADIPYYNWNAAPSHGRKPAGYNRRTLVAGGANWHSSSGSGSYSTGAQSVGTGIIVGTIYDWSAPILGGGEVFAGIEGASIRLLPPYIALVKIVKLPKPAKP